jgi:prevent-host-death family protein
MYIFMYMMWMAKSYSVADARSKLSEIVDAVEEGKDVEITRRGRKVAVVMSAARFARLRGDRIAFATAYESFLREHDLARIGVEPSWAAELRDRDPGRQVKP